MMMSVYKRFVKMHNYFNESIHHWQVIYKIFYGVFIQLNPALLGCKCIKFNLAKGSWYRHELLVKQIQMALYVSEQRNSWNFMESSLKENVKKEVLIVQTYFGNFSLGFKTILCHSKHTPAKKQIWLHYSWSTWIAGNSAMMELIWKTGHCWR